MLLSNLDLLATAPGGVARLRELILTLAVQGKLVPQDPADEPAGELLKKIRAEKDRLIAEGKIRRDKPLAAIAEGEKPFGLPVGWEWVRLGALLPFRIGKTPPSKDPQYWADSGHAWVSISDMNHFGEVFETGRKITDRGAGVFGYDLLPSGTLIMSFKLTIGKISVLRVPAYHNEAIVSFTPLSGLDSGFLKYMLPTVAKTGASKDALMGATLNTESLSNLVIALPPHSEQSRIVTRVEMLMRLCDALEAKGRLEAAQHAQLVSTLLGTLTASATPEELTDNWQRVAQHFDLLLDRPQAIDALEQTLLQLAVRGLLVPQDPSDEPAFSYLSGLHASVPDQSARDTKHVKFQRDDENLQKGWCWTSIAGIAECLDYMRKPVKKDNRGTYNAGVPYYGANGQVGWIDDFIFDEDLVLVVEDETFIGRTKPFSYVIRGRSWVNNHAHVLRPREGMNLDYLNMCLERYDFVPLTSGTTNRRKLTKAGLLDAQVMLPPLAEQSRIVTRVTQLRRLCADLRQRLAEREAVQARLAEALVQQVA